MHQPADLNVLYVLSSLWRVHVEKNKKDFNKTLYD